MSRDLNAFQRSYSLPVPCYDVQYQQRIVADAIIVFPLTQELLADILALAVLYQPDGILWAGLLVEVLYQRLTAKTGPWSLAEEITWNFWSQS